MHCVSRGDIREGEVGAREQYGHRLDRAVAEAEGRGQHDFRPIHDVGELLGRHHRRPLGRIVVLGRRRAPLTHDRAQAAAAVDTR